jgi:cation:H+ antiporter
MAGAKLLVRGAASIATRLGITPVIIGLTVVAFGTSAPELAVSVNASVGGEGSSRSATSPARTSRTSS